MKNYKIGIIVLNLIILMVYINWSIFKKEKTLSEGVLALFELAPVDPRSLMQGDYMDLRYAISRASDENTERPNRGYCVINLDAHQVAKKVRFQKGSSPLTEGEYLVKYFIGAKGLSLGAESYFFEEGTAQKYEVAEYGGLRIDAAGNSILVGLYDKDYKLIE